MCNRSNQSEVVPVDRGSLQKMKRTPSYPAFLPTNPKRPLFVAKQLIATFSKIKDIEIYHAAIVCLGMADSTTGNFHSVNNGSWACVMVADLESALVLLNSVYPRVVWENPVCRVSPCE